MQRDHGKRSELIESLRTKTHAEAIRLSRPVIERFDMWLRAAEAKQRGDLARLSDREVSALCARWLAQQEALYRDHLPLKSAETLEDEAGQLSDILAGLDSGTAIGGLSDAVAATQDDASSLLAQDGIKVDQDTQERLAVRLLHVMWQWQSDLVVRARTGKWTPSASSASFPAGPTRLAARGHPLPCTFDMLLEG